ncbi:oligosaccharide flippase family protein [Rhodohalobacter sp. 8-1]|uniref:oligosaccharide flippase family protein n=1 Tax=Rhodohalobacter sp. 8-1 TaxID=3131972 RepID=UPI0030ED376A
MIPEFIKSDFYKNVVTLIGGTGVAQIIPIAISPVLTRIYSPDEFGLLAFYASFVAIIGVVATGRYEMAILIPDSLRKAKNLAAFSFLIVGVVAALSFIILALFGNIILDFLGFGEFTLLSFLIPAGILLIASFQVFIYLLNRIKNYKGIATAKITRSFGGSGFQLLFGYTGLTTYGLIIGKLIGDVLSTIYGWWLTQKAERLKRIPLIWLDMKKESWMYREFPKVNAPHALTNTSSSNLPNILLAAFFSPAIAGFYSLSHRVCFAPITLISSSVQQVYSRSLTEKHNDEKNIHTFTVSVFKQLAIIGIIPFGILLIFAPDLFELIFGENWREAGVYSQILTPFLFLVFVISPLTYVPLLLNRQRKAFLIDIIYLVLRVLALGAGLWLGSVIIAIIAFSAVGVLVQIYLLFWILSLTKSTR